MWSQSWTEWSWPITKPSYHSDSIGQIDTTNHYDHSSMQTSCQEDSASTYSLMYDHFQCKIMCRVVFFMLIQFLRLIAYHLSILLGSYNNRDHNFELTMLSLVILYIPFLFCKYFPMLNNVKRVCPKRIIKGQKETKIKKVKNMNPKQK